MKLIKLISFLFAINLSGCATVVQYTPAPPDTIEQALIAVERAINTSPLKKGVMLNLADEKHLELVGTFRGGGTQKNILYETIHNLTLSSKRKYFSVTIYDLGDIIQHRFYFLSQSKAQQLIDGLDKLTHHAIEEVADYTLSIRYGDNVKKVYIAHDNDSKNTSKLQKEKPKYKKDKQTKISTSSVTSQKTHITKAKKYRKTDAFKSKITPTDFSGELTTRFLLCSVSISPTFRNIECIDSQKGFMAPEYKKIKKMLRGNTPAINKLKDLYSYWMAIMDGLSPDQGEMLGTYKKRITESGVKLKQMANRYQLEL